MNARKEFLEQNLRSYLGRRSMPRSLEGKPDAQREELAALVACVSRFAPNIGYDSWWPGFVVKLAEDGQTRAWPTEGEIKKAATVIRGTITKTVSEGDEVDPLDIIAKRIKANEPVGDGYIYGRLAVDLLRSGRVSRDELTAYRSGFYFHLRKVYGDDEAREIEARCILRHQDAETLDDNVRRARRVEIPEPKKPATYEWDGAAE